MDLQNGFEDTRDNVAAQIQAIHTANPRNLMARHFNENLFDALSSSQQKQFLKIIASGLENPDSEMGAYAQHVEDYAEFALLLDPMIRDFHGLRQDGELKQHHDWAVSDPACTLATIDPQLNEVSMRVRVGRNFSSFPLPGAMTRTQRLEAEALMIEAFDTLRKESRFGGKYLSLSPGSSRQIDEAEFLRRVNAHQMFKDMSGDPYLSSAGISADWPFGRGMYVSEAEDFLVWVGEEDQLRVMAMSQGGDLSGLFTKLNDGLERLSALLPAFAHSARYGYITSCPTNLGTAMRASLHLPLPRLTKNGSDLGAVKEAASGLGLAVRGAGGEHSQAGRDGLVDISPRARMGVTERDIMHRLYSGVAALWSLEKSV